MLQSLHDQLTLSLLLEDHDFDPLTGFCRACGQAQGHILANRVECFGGGNVVAMSHRRYAARLEQKFGHGRYLAIDYPAFRAFDVYDEEPPPPTGERIEMIRNSWAVDTIPDQPA